MPTPPLLAGLPFGLLLLAIATLPLVPRVAHWWEHNSSKLLVAGLLSVCTLAYYALRPAGVELHEPAAATALQTLQLPVTDHGGHPTTGPGAAALAGALLNAVLEYLPFVMLLFSLYYVTGGIQVQGDLPARPATNTAVLAIGGLLASVVGTTGASMLLIRPLLQTNAERRRVAHTVVFFIFIVSNIGGTLLPIGDPPLFIGYLRGVPFLWTLRLWPAWALLLGVLLCVYYVWDCREYRRESPAHLALDRVRVQGLQVRGLVNLAWIALVVAAVALLAPHRPLPGTGWHPPLLFRELVLAALCGVSALTTPRVLRAANRFGLHAMGEVAALFIGIFITMQVPLEILRVRGGELGLTAPWHFFWATGLLSGLLDNAPTYAVFLEVAARIPPGPHGAVPLFDGVIDERLLTAVSLGAVFMGALTYIGNGPNFMVKSIAEQHGVRMPGFAAYALIALAVLLPPFVLVTILFIR